MRRRPFLLFFSLLLLLTLAPCGLTASRPSGRQVILLLIDRVELKDLDRPDLPNLAWCLRHGAVGLMNTRTGARGNTQSAADTYLTIGAGRRGMGGPETGAAYRADEVLEGGTAGDVLWRNTGYRPRPENIVLPGIIGLSALNTPEDRTFRPGLLGDLLHAAGLRTCVLGNADTPESPGRYAVALAMDGQGVVDYGEIGQRVLITDPTWPFGWRTDYRTLTAAFNRYAGRAALVVVELGDTTRVDLYSPYLLPSRIEPLRHRALLAADNFLGRLRQEIDLNHTLLMILTPTPKTEAQNRGYTLTPIILIGPGFAGGRLFSATTKQPGIVTNLDILPTVAAFLGLPVPAEAAGHRLVTRPTTGPLLELRKEEARLLTLAFWQQPILKSFTVFLDILFLACALALLWPELPWRKPLNALLLLAGVVPLGLLLTPLPTTPARFFLSLLLVLGTLYVLFLLLARQGSPHLFLLCLATAVTVLVDQYLGAPLAKRSLLSYSPLAGARFYGLGNEYMGVLLGATSMVVGYAFEYRPGNRWCGAMIAAFLFFVVFTVGWPGLGTNLGGFLAAIVGLGVGIGLFTGKKIFRRQTLLWAGGAICFLVLLGVLDSLRPAASQTHFGRLVATIRAEGFGPFWDIVRRKLAMNFKLIRFSGWSRVALFALLALGVTALLPSRRQFSSAHPFLVKSIWTSLAAAAGALAFNDSGIVAAGTLLIFPTVSWLTLLLQEAPDRAEKKEGKTGP